MRSLLAASVGLAPLALLVGCLFCGSRLHVSVAVVSVGFLCWRSLLAVSAGGARLAVYVGCLSLQARRVGTVWMVWAAVIG